MQNYFFGALYIINGSNNQRQVNYYKHVNYYVYVGSKIAEAAFFSSVQTKKISQNIQSSSGNPELVIYLKQTLIKVSRGPPLLYWFIGISYKEYNRIKILFFPLSVILLSQFPSEDVTGGDYFCFSDLKKRT
ncbi:hypothetical protein BpHYR1_033155 [Brachionus plicatilis]|uniref:Uncharacterized protein n=1 Tax=Brachionus plicatilis TaxID=10195 RepID=A0A3M7QMI8_BRAPC|nr:hypothetical protein BpHYR1_033155 [Brachionus plicatilis]